MNVSRLALAAFGAFAAYFVLGGLSFKLVPSLRNEFLRYPAVYRSQDSMKSVMPAGMAHDVAEDFNGVLHGSDP
jgi:hypothetical protein